MKEKIVLMGAGSAMFTRGLVADVIRGGWDCALALVDTSADALAVAEGLARAMIAHSKAPIRLSADTCRRTVLQDATVVICTIGVGGRRAWEQDVFVPRRHGIYQPVGDSVMPGGSSRALRMIPAMVEIAEDVLELAPRALFFNYANPMAPICRAVRKATGAPVVGLCHGVIDTASELARILGVASDALDYTAVGINHLTWFTELRAADQDAMPRLRALGRALIDQARRQEEDNPDGRAGDVRNRFCWELLDLFGAYPAPGDRHVCEFFPQMFKDEGAYYGKTLGVDAFSLEATIAAGDDAFESMREVADSGDLPADFFAKIGGEHEQVIDIIRSIRTESGAVYSANLPNGGRVPSLPDEAIVESPAVAKGNGLHALALSPLAPGIVGTLATRMQWVETIVDAALTGSRNAFVQALVLDGAADSLAAAAALAEDLLAAQAAYLPPLKPSPEASLAPPNEAPKAEDDR